MYNVQVSKHHYAFKKYFDKKRWLSLWHQIDEILSISPQSLLEIGPGPGALKTLLQQFGINALTFDIDPALEPDYVGSVLNLPFKDNTFQCVCSFQMLEHLPYEKSLEAFKEIVRVSQEYVILSLPDAKKRWPITLCIPKLGSLYIHIPEPRFRPRKHVFDGEHYWEINKKDYSLNKVIEDFKSADVKLIKTFRVKDNPYHRFMLFSKQQNG